MPSRPHDLRSARGFTLMELLIVVAIIGVLAALAIAGYRKYVHAAQSSEARVIMGQIRNGEENYRAEMQQYLSCSATLADYYPNMNPDDSRWTWVQPGDARFTNAVNGWKMLSIHPDGPVRFGYAVVAGVAPQPLPSPGPGFTSPPTLSTTLTAGTPWFVIQARNKHVSSWQAAMAITTSYDDKVYMENEGN